MRKLLSLLYRSGLVAAACFLALIAVVVLAQVFGRFVGIVIPSADEVAGFSMAASIFLGLAATLRARAHVRVELVMSRSPYWLRRGLELWSHAFAAALLGFLAWHTADMTWMSLVLDERSPGLWSIPLWVPQSGMSIGLALMAVACLEGVVDIAQGRDTATGDSGPSIQSE